ncbi:glutathione S-transferase family protein [Aquabacter spiritensis]|uniref:Glutathione S-transferase n=1 Tax=Aquabacter spiritensis TaxID=933073 RepID=A0A4R3LVF4_9HYPH|nr:glutathione S-transferase [Aquabacter spiritensis]TCT02417.1 glutathione S-transferase [Aquabacter spiritensis]
MQLYLSTRSPNPRRVQFFLAEKGITVPTVFVDLAKMEHLDGDFLRLNPRKKVPVLVLDDGTAIAESIAICRYFEAAQPTPNLFGATPAEQGLVEMWMRQAEIELMLPVQFAFRHLHPALAEREVPQVKEWGEANKPKVLDFLAYMDARLSGSAFLALDRFTIADIVAIVAVDFMRAARIAVPETLTHVARWRAEVSARPAAAAGV